MEEKRKELISEIQRLAEEVDGTPRQKDVHKESDYSLSQFRRVFGSWNEAVESAGFKSYPNRRRIPQEDLIDELHNLEEELSKPPSADEMTAYGEYSHAVYIDRFGSWHEALEEAGFTPPSQNDGPTTQELIEELQRLSEELGRIPSSKDADEHGKYSYSAYYREFDGFTDALKEADLI